MADVLVDIRQKIAQAAHRHFGSRRRKRARRVRVLVHQNDTERSRQALGKESTMGESCLELRLERQAYVPQVSVSKLEVLSKFDTRRIDLQSTRDVIHQLSRQP